MHIPEKTVDCLEILISTMHKSGLEFLEGMFVNSELKNQHLLIINQTTEDCLLSSSNPKIRVINSFERGLPQSRNLAIKNAREAICLISDDDVVYEKGFEDIILKAHSRHELADMVTFKMTDFEGQTYRDYPDILWHDEDTIRTANSVVISFKRERLLKQNVEFNDNFGLGTVFQTGNEYIFLRNALKKKLKLLFEPKIILSHPKFNSGTDVGSDKILYARAAIFYKYSGLLGYLRLLKHVFSLHKLKRIKSDEFWSKLHVGLRGIRDYKRLVRDGKEQR